MCTWRRSAVMFGVAVLLLIAIGRLGGAAQPTEIVNKQIRMLERMLAAAEDYIKEQHWDTATATLQNERCAGPSTAWATVDLYARAIAPGSDL